MKKDIVGSAIIGFLIAVLFLVIQYITITVIQPDQSPPFYYWFSLAIFPLGSVLGIILLGDIREKLGGKFFAIYQFYKFALVGGLNALINASIYSGFIVMTGIAVGNPVTLFQGIAFSASVMNSYFWNKRWTFSAKGGGVRQFGEFLTISIGGLMISLASVHIIVNIIGPLGGISERAWAHFGNMAIALTAIWNFLGYRYIVFRKLKNK